MMTVSESGTGFTLMEVMVSMAVIGIVLVSLFRVQSGSIDLTGANRFQNTAVLLAQRQLALFENALDETDRESGRFEAPFESYQWNLEITDINEFDDRVIPNNNAGILKKIKIDITQENSSRSYHVETFRYSDNP